MTIFFFFLIKCITVITNIILESALYYFGLYFILDYPPSRYFLLVSLLASAGLGCQVWVNCTRNHHIMFRKQNVNIQTFKKKKKSQKRPVELLVSSVSEVSWIPSQVFYHLASLKFSTLLKSDWNKVMWLGSTTHSYSHYGGNHHN